MMKNPTKVAKNCEILTKPFSCDLERISKNTTKRRVPVASPCRRADAKSKAVLSPGEVKIIPIPTPAI